ncbi:hypothetical protein Ga0123461_0891 [Mariprofundus aestuarium]|uniref:SpoIIAA-like n=1 Tax=Mariprofundus aestuarium TaxID=1921086 RepID=A0A2K8L0H6_MARES|nr:hypothetical protein Ga0123461_0891 [Mariprofundus aestuarium]
MHIENIWQDDGSGLHRRYIGNLSMYDVLEATIELQEHRRFDSLHYIIEDYTSATNAPFESRSMKDFGSVVELRSRARSALKVAIVSRNSPESTAAAHTFCEQMNKSHYKCQVFHSFAEAQTWAAGS